MTRMCRSWTRSRTSVPVRVRPTPMWCSRPATRRVTQPALSILSWRTRSWMSRARSVPGVALGRAVSAVAGVARWQGAVRPVVVVGGDEDVEQGLQLRNRGRLGGLRGQPFLHRLLEPFDLAAGGGVVRAGVLLHDVAAAELVLEVVASAVAAGEAGGVDGAVVGEGGERVAVLGSGPDEAGDHDRRGDPGVRRDVQGVAGVVVQPGDDLGVGGGAQS